VGKNDGIKKEGRTYTCSKESRGGCEERSCRPFVGITGKRNADGNRGQWAASISFGPGGNQWGLRTSQGVPLHCCGSGSKNIAQAGQKKGHQQPTLKRESTDARYPSHVLGNGRGRAVQRKEEPTATAMASRGVINIEPSALWQKRTDNKLAPLASSRSCHSLPWAAVIGGGGNQKYRHWFVKRTMLDTPQLRNCVKPSRISVRIQRMMARDWHGGTH